MEAGKARKGDYVHFAKEGHREGEAAISIVKGKVNEIIWPGTTNEYFEVEFVSLPTGASLTLFKSPEECFQTPQEARNDARTKIYEKLEILHQQLTALGDHSFSPSRWHGD